MWALWGLLSSLSVAGALLWQTQLFAALTCLATCWTLPCLGSAAKRPKPITSPSGLYKATWSGRPSLSFPHFPWCLGPRPSEGGRSPQQAHRWTWLLHAAPRPRAAPRPGATGLGAGRAGKMAVTEATPPPPQEALGSWVGSGAPSKPEVAEETPGQLSWPPGSVTESSLGPRPFRAGLKAHGSQTSLKNIPLEGTVSPQMQQCQRAGLSLRPSWLKKGPRRPQRHPSLLGQGSCPRFLDRTPCATSGFW